MSSKLYQDENENVIAQNGPRLSNGNSCHSEQLPSPDSFSVNITTTENTILSDDDEDPATMASTKLADSRTPSSNSLKPQSASATHYAFKAKFYRTLRSAVWIFPLLLVILVPLACLTPYTMAIKFKSVEAIFPYVSDAGGITPQAAYFSQVLDLIAILIFITSYVRYKMLKMLINVKMVNSAKTNEAVLSRLNRLNFVASLVIYSSALGVIIIGNFRVTEIASGHFFGVAFAFSGMFVYMIIMSYICYELSRCAIESRPYSMFVISIAAGTSLFFCMTFSALSIYQAGWTRFFDNSFRLHWRKHDDGFVSHCIGTAFEWVAILTVSPFYMCIFNRMKQFTDWKKVDF